MSTKNFKTMSVAFVPAIFILFVACSGSKDDAQPAPTVITLNCPTRTNSAAYGRNPSQIPGALQLANIPNQLPSVAPGIQQIQVTPGQNQTLSCPEQPDDRASRENLERMVRQASQVCANAYAPNAASLVPLILMAPNPAAAQNAVQVVPGTPVNQAAASNCQGLVTQIDYNFKTMGNGQYANQPGAKQWLVNHLGSGIVRDIAAQSNLNPAVLANPAARANLTAAGQTYYASRIAPIVGNTSFGQTALSQVSSFR